MMLKKKQDHFFDNLIDYTNPFTIMLCLKILAFPEIFFNVIPW